MHPIPLVHAAPIVRSQLQAAAIEHLDSDLSRNSRRPAMLDTIHCGHIVAPQFTILIAAKGNHG